jgi:hypothetical protein
MVYSGNRYLTLEEMKVNAQYIFDFLILKGWTKNAIAGILGNMETESTINPAIWEGLNEGNTSGGFGLVQWTPATKYFDWCTPLNLTPEAMDSNLMRILYEVENNIQWGNDSLGNPPPYTFQQFTQSTETAYDLGMNFLRFYERPANPDQPDRGNQAEFWFSFLHGKVKKKSKIYMYLKNNRRRLMF